MDYLGLADRSWPLLNRVAGLHTLVYRATHGLVGHRFPGGPSMLLLDHVGANSGVKRTSPLLYLDDEPNLVIVASKGGHPRHPAWFHNLRATPETTVQVGSERRSVRARTATPEERRRLWPRAVEIYGNYDQYQQRTGRQIPVIILEPR
jgi:F420H(2)-dependent quinone reductase